MKVGDIIILSMIVLFIGFFFFMVMMGIIQTGQIHELKDNLCKDKGFDEFRGKGLRGYCIKEGSVIIADFFIECGWGLNSCEIYEVGE